MISTIIALSSSPGTSGLAIIRLSGPQCLEVIHRHLKKIPVSHHMTYASFRNGEGEVLDRLNFVYMQAPKTSTGEDVLELFPHGNMLLVQCIMESILQVTGIRLAEPGEFTRRSFENGKIDLLQAESVGQLIHSQNLQALQNAQKILSGVLSTSLRKLREDLVDISLRLELDVDFSEEEADPDYASWEKRLVIIANALEELTQSFERGKRLQQMPRIGLFGAPNAGKSSLINALIQEDRLLVSHIAGTTRDYVEVPLNLPGGRVLLVDTAGLGKPVDGLDEQAMQRTRAQLEKVECKILVCDGTQQNQDENQNEVTANFDIKILSKKDLPGFKSEQKAIAISSITHEGINELLNQLNALFFATEGGEGLMLTTERQYYALNAAKANVNAALVNLRISPAIEIMAFEIREASEHLRELLGEIAPEEILQKIFAGFCIGK